MEQKPQSLFIDEVVIEVVSGKGGDGCVSFRREKYVPRGGPNGGDGGRGGDVVLKASEQLHTLLDQKYQRFYRAAHGGRGSSKNQTGKSVAPLIIPVPVGTMVYDTETNLLLSDLISSGQEYIVARGGRGGRGNTAFKTSTLQAPRTAEEGAPGESKIIRLELKLMADVGLVGFPNAGKSTLISRISAARPRIADYPFTTLIPNLGIVRLPNYSSLVVADIPGIIENAHLGAGLGLRFLRHIERTRFLLLIIDLSPLNERDSVAELDILLHELRNYSQTLADKPFFVVGNKIDLPDHTVKLHQLTAELRERGLPLYAISAVTGAGVQHLLTAVWQAVQEDPE